MKSARVFAHITLIAFIIGILQPVAWTQELTGRTANIGQSMSTSLNGTNALGSNTDVILGKNAKGPYLLSWKPVKEDTEQVQVNSRRMQRGVDYSIDYNTGTLAFTDPVDNKAIIRAEYSCDPTKATRNNAPLNLPLTLDLMKKQNSSLKFRGLLKQADMNATASSGVAVLGLEGEKNAKEGSISSMLLFSSDRSQSKGAEDGSFLDKAALTFKGSATTDTLTLKTSFARIGSQFTGAKDYSLQQGAQIMDLSLAYDPSGLLSFSSSVKRTENLMGDKKGEVVSSSQHDIVLAPEGGPKMTLTHAVQGKEKPGAAEQSTTSDRIQLQHKLNDAVSATALHEIVRTDVGGSGSDVTTNQLVVSAQAAKNMSIRSQLTQKDSSVTGNEAGLNLNIDATPISTMTVKATVNRLKTTRAGQNNSETLNVVTDPKARTSVILNLAHQSTDAAGQDIAHSMKIKSSPMTNLAMELAVAGRSADLPVDDATRIFHVTSTQVKRVKVDLDYANRDSEVKGAEESGKVRVEASPVDAVTVTAAVGQRTTADTRDVSREATLQVRPFSHTTVGGGYRELESNGAMATRVTEVNASTKPADFLEFTGAYKQREVASQRDLNTLNLDLTLGKGGGPFWFKGSYKTNPEDNKGVVQRAESQSLKLVSELGWLRLKGGFTLTDNYLVGKLNQTTELGLDFKLSSRSLLTTGYKLDEYREQSTLDTSIYSLGYSRNMGSDFNLYVGGKMTTYERDQALLKDQTQYEAEAKFGLRF